MQNTSLVRYISLDNDQFNIYAQPKDFRYVLLQDNIVTVALSDSYYYIQEQSALQYKANSLNDALNYYNLVMQKINLFDFTNLTCDDTHKIYIRSSDVVGFGNYKCDAENNIPAHNAITMLYKDLRVLHLFPPTLPSEIVITPVRIKQVPFGQDISKEFKYLVSQFNQLPHENKQAISKNKSSLWKDWEIIGKDNDETKGAKAKYVDKSTNVVTNYRINQIKVF